MRTTAAPQVVRALEDEGARFAFGIPGTHNIELYDALAGSKVTAVLVTDEQCASFMADGVSRSSGSVGVVNLAMPLQRARSPVREGPRPPLAPDRWASAPARGAGTTSARLRA